jgi:holo-ACP synthase CitX
MKKRYNSMATLEEILVARDERAALQFSLIAEYGYPLVVCTMNIPGSTKNDATIQAGFDKSMEAFSKLNEANLEKVLERRLETGPEAYFIVTGGTNLLALKRRLAFFEQTYPIGRWLDLDVKRLDGTPISRKDINLESRKCLICHRPAKECARNQRHSLEELCAMTNENLELFLAKGSSWR